MLAVNLTCMENKIFCYSLKTKCLSVISALKTVIVSYILEIGKGQQITVMFSITRKKSANINFYTCNLNEIHESET